MPTGKYRYYFASIWKILTGIQNWPQAVRVFLGLASSGPHLIQLRKNGLRLKTRSAMDIWGIKETFLDEFYLRYGFPIGEGWTILDIGGGIGDFTIQAAVNSARSQVYAFEPTPGSMALLKENLVLNAVTNVQAFPEAIWSQTGELVIDTAAGEPSQFTSRQIDSAPPLGERLRVPSLSLAAAFDRLDLERCDLLKMDCEGAEYEILFHAPNQILGRIDRIVMEYHDGSKGRTHLDLADFLSRQGFRVETFRNFVHADLGYLRAWREV